MVKKLIFASKGGEFTRPKAHAASRSWYLSRPPSRSLQRTIPLSPLAPRFGKGKRSRFCLPWLIALLEFLVYGSGDLRKHASPNHSRASLNLIVEPGLYMLLRFQKAGVRENYETGNQAFSMRLRFLTIRAVGTKRNPVRLRGENFDFGAPIGVGRGAASEASNLVNVERGAETDKDASAQRSDDLLWRAGRGEKDGLHAGPDVAHLLDQRQAFVNGGVWVGDDNVEGLLAQTANRARATSSAFTVAIDGGERLRDRTDRVRLFADKKNAAHTVLLSSIDDNSRACLSPLS